MQQPLTLYKLIILYMLDSVSYPLTNTQFSDFILGNNYTSFFHLQQAIGEMLEAQLIESETVRKVSYYTISETGQTTLAFFEKNISPAIKEEIHEFFSTNGTQIRKRVFTLSDYTLNANREYDVHLQVKERNATLIDLTIQVPTQEAAETACDHWADKCQSIYAHIIDELF
ncbi:MAG: DUF4364 family protein [Lachnospiraceae bacterium]